jgi:hypothetical protein
MPLTDETHINDLIARLKAMTDGNAELDHAVAQAMGMAPACYTTSFCAARSLLPTSVTNFSLFSFGYRNDERGDYWGCRVHDRAQLVGIERAKRGVKSLQLPITLGEEPRVLLERAIAERFCEFSVTHAATPFLAICIISLKIRIGKTTDDDL